MTYITMNIVDGEELHSAWYDMSDRKERWVVEQLKGYLAQLRALKPPIDGAVTSITGGPLRDGSRVGLETFGPFQNHDDFHQFLRGAGIPMEVFEKIKIKGVEKVVHSHRQRYVTKFTHGDFAPRTW